MKIQLWSLGKPNEPYVHEGIQMFTKRINNYFSADWKIVPPLKNAATFSEAEMKEKEGELILSQLKKEDYLILLDERGKMLNSEALANKLQQCANESCRQLVFLIGGAYGVSDSVMKRADFRWSLSALVFPHQLVRLILSEQLYRACTILRNEKYHHT